MPVAQSFAERWRRRVADLLYPSTCSGCGERGVWICERCLASIPEFAEIPGCCRRCGLPIVGGRCGCGALHPKVARAASAFPYSGWVSRAIVGVKYEGERDRSEFLGSVLAVSSAGPLLAAADVVVPVPMYSRRERERGYNQVAVMAGQACRVLGHSPPLPIVVQHEERRSQVGLSASQRRQNVRGSFSLDSVVSIRPGSRIVLVDDVRTTGATLMACSDALRPVRPARIDVVTFAAELSPEVEERLGLKVPKTPWWRD